MNTTDLLAKELSVLNWSSARVVLIAHAISALIKLRTVNLTRWAVVFETDAQMSSNYKRLQRFFRFFELDFETLVKLIARWLACEPWVLCLDRTNWQIGSTNVNILMLAVAHRGIAVPLLWTMLDKKGNSSTDERIALMKRFIALFGTQRIAYLTADREFRGQAWLRYLVDERIGFCLRIPNNTRVDNKPRNRQLPVTRLFALQVNETMLLRQARRVWGISVYLGAIRTADEPIIVIANAYTPALLSDYARRWEIETLFGCLKSRGFDLEQTRLRDPERLSKLLALLTIAFTWCYRIGQWQAERKPIRRLKHGRPAYSLFRYGLDYFHRLLIMPPQRALRHLREVLQILFDEQTPHENLGVH